MYISIVQVNGFLLTHLVIFGWTPVDRPFCELVASGMSSRMCRMEYIDILPIIVCVRSSEPVSPRGNAEGTRSPLVSTSEATPSANMSPSWLPTISTLSYLTLTLITTAFVCLSCAFLIVQATRSSPSRSIKDNWNVVIIGAAYVLVVCLP
ncbi:hypothetical protein BDM02DRAFT_116943 [Thelephora ganbajun]|uniref:Uncharacterized protein n=1 Tax=Thelephora ganbajun TaxID=370292 RepID=A0ACB6ZWY7_THEGA|nr:hypothetical protein BDM02DRAFT_116943 [Thelephora ganbajun]